MGRLQEIESRMKAVLIALVAAAGLAGPADAASWGVPRFEMQPPGKGRGGGFERPRDAREYRHERREERRERFEERRERLSDDERRALHRDLDKANRELYQRR